VVPALAALHEYKKCEIKYKKIIKYSLGPFRAYPAKNRAFLYCIASTTGNACCQQAASPGLMARLGGSRWSAPHPHPPPSAQMGHPPPRALSAGLDLLQIRSLCPNQATSVISYSPVGWMAGIQTIASSLIRPLPNFMRTPPY
jgi:hypothetical protein